MKHIERLEQIISELASGNASEFARMIGVTPQRIAMWQKRGSFDAEYILDKLPEISAEWVMRGNGTMLLENTSEEEKLRAINAHLKKSYDDLLNTIENIKK